MRKLIIGLTLMILLTPVVLATFTDVATTHENYTAINYLQQEGVIGGYSDSTFRPNNTINRAEMMKLLVEGLGITPDAAKYRNCFPDVGTEWYAPYVCYAKEKNWVGGYPDKTFKPANTVLDVEAMKMILNARGVQLDTTYTPLLFATVPLDAWYRPYLVTAEKLNLTDYFKPGNNYKRGEVAEVVFRTLIIERADVSSYSEQARIRVFNEEAQAPKASYGPAAYLNYSNAKRTELEGTKPFAIFFHASWCPTCRAIESDLQQYLDTYPDGVTILKADYDTETALREEFKVTRQYWFVVFDKDGKVTFSNNLFKASDVIEKIEATL